MLLAKHPKLFHFLPRCYPGHDMPCQTAQHHTLRLRNLQLMNHIPDYRRKSVPVVMTERRQLVTPSSKLHRLGQSHLLPMLTAPQLHRPAIPVRCGSMLGLFGSTEGGILGADKLPGVGSQPPTLHPRPRLVCRFARATSATPELFNVPLPVRPYVGSAENRS